MSNRHSQGNEEGLIILFNDRKLVCKRRGGLLLLVTLEPSLLQRTTLGWTSIPKRIYLIRMGLWHGSP